MPTLVNQESHEELHSNTSRMREVDTFHVSTVSTETQQPLELNEIRTNYHASISKKGKRISSAPENDDHNNLNILNIVQHTSGRVYKRLKKNEEKVKKQSKEIEKQSKEIERLQTVVVELNKKIQKQQNPTEDAKYSENIKILEEEIHALKSQHNQSMQTIETKDSIIEKQHKRIENLEIQLESPLSRNCDIHKPKTQVSKHHLERNELNRKIMLLEEELSVQKKNFGLYRYIFDDQFWKPKANLRKGCPKGIIKMRELMSSSQHKSHADLLQGLQEIATERLEKSYPTYSCHFFKFKIGREPQTKCLYESIRDAKNIEDIWVENSRNSHESDDSIQNSSIELLDLW